MKSLKEKLDWPDSAFCQDKSLSGGAAQIDFDKISGDVCVIPFSESSKYGKLSTSLSDLFAVGDFLRFSDKFLQVTNRRLSFFSLNFWLDKFMVLLMIITGNRDQISANIFDISLDAYENPGRKQDFPFNQPLPVKEMKASLSVGTTNPYVVVFDEENNASWVLTTEVFSHVQFIHVSEQE